MVLRVSAVLVWPYSGLQVLVALVETENWSLALPTSRFHPGYREDGNDGRMVMRVCVTVRLRPLGILEALDPSTEGTVVIFNSFV